jgi:hypothetical protein
MGLPKTVEMVLDLVQPFIDIMPAGLLATACSQCARVGGDMRLAWKQTSIMWNHMSWAAKECEGIAHRLWGWMLGYVQMWGSRLFFMKEDILCMWKQARTGSRWLNGVREFGVDMLELISAPARILGSLGTWVLEWNSPSVRKMALVAIRSLLALITSLLVLYGFVKSILFLVRLVRVMLLLFVRCCSRRVQDEMVMGSRSTCEARPESAITSGNAVDFKRPIATAKSRSMTPPPRAIARGQAALGLVQFHNVGLPRSPHL